MSDESGSLAIFSKAALMLAEADTIQKAKELKSLALTAAEWAKRRNMGEEAIQHCRSYALEAERKMGEMLISTERAKGASVPKHQRSTHKEGRSETPKLSELGISWKESSDAQLLAKLPAEEFEEVKRGKKTKADVKRKFRRAERVEKIAEIAKGNAELKAAKRYPVICADPPWRYEHIETESRAIENHYPTMSLEEICALPLSDVTTEDAVLFLWATSPKLEESLRVLNAWGFTYRTCMVWVKDKIGMGYYARQKHELLLIAAKGSLPTPEPKDRPSSVIHGARTKHSAKPAEFYALIERMYPDLPRLEMFARSPRDGWDRWGNQA